MKTQIWATYSHHLPLIAATMIFSCIAVVEYTKLSETRQLLATDTSSTQPAIASQKQEIGKVSELDLFGTNAQPVVSAANSKIKINGIFMATPKEKSTVALTVNGSDEQLYKQGERIKGDGQITQIAEQYILVLNNGKPTKILLTMEDNSPDGAVNPIMHRGIEPAPIALPNAVPNPGEIVPAAAPDAADEPTTITPPPQVMPGQFAPGYQNNPRMNPLFRGRGRFGGGM